MNERWIEDNRKYILKTKKGCASIEHTSGDMTILLVKNKDGIIRDAYAQRQLPLEEEKIIAESRLNQIY